MLNRFVQMQHCILIPTHHQPPSALGWQKSNLCSKWSADHCVLSMLSPIKWKPSPFQNVEFSPAERSTSQALSPLEPVCMWVRVTRENTMSRREPSTGQRARDICESSSLTRAADRGELSKRPSHPVDRGPCTSAVTLVRRPRWVVLDDVCACPDLLACILRLASQCTHLTAGFSAFYQQGMLTGRRSGARRCTWRRRLLGSGRVGARTYWGRRAGQPRARRPWDQEGVEGAGCV